MLGSFPQKQCKKKRPIFNLLTSAGSVGTGITAGKEKQ